MPEMLEMYLMFVPLTFGLVLVGSFLAIFLFFSCGLEMFTLCHYILEVSNFFLVFIKNKGLTAKSFLEKIVTFEQCWNSYDLRNSWEMN
jgi:hypothetical protein